MLNHHAYSTWSLRGWSGLRRCRAASAYKLRIRKEAMASLVSKGLQSMCCDYLYFWPQHCLCLVHSLKAMEVTK